MKFVASGFLFFVFTGHLALAGTKLWVRSPQASEAELKAFLSLKPEAATLIERFEDERSRHPVRRRLFAALEEAQKAYFLEPLDSARAKMEEVAGFLWQHDWPHEDRKALFDTLLRLAQTAPTEPERRDWLQKARDFAPDLSPDRELFPPPLVAAFGDLPQPSLLWDSRQTAPHAEVVFVNGRRWNVRRETRIPLATGKNRVTLLSSAHLEKTAIREGSYFLETPWEATPVVQGECTHPVWSMPKLPVDGAFFPGACVFDPASGDRPEAGTAVDLAPSPVSVAPSDVVASLQKPLPERREPRSRISRRWLWWGLGLLAASAVVINQRESTRERSGPTEKEGL